MRAVTWQGRGDVEVNDVPDPRTEQPNDLVVRVSSTAICGSDLHLYGPLTPFMTPGDILGHEFMGTVVEVGSEVKNVRPGDRIVVPETRPDDRWLFLSDILPTAWQGVAYTGLEPGETIAVIGLVPVGQLATRCAWQQGAGRVIGVNLEAERLAMAAQHGVEVIDVSRVDDVPGAIKDLTAGRRADRVIDAVGMEAHGSTAAKIATDVVTTLPRAAAAVLSQAIGVDRLAALETAFASVRRGGTVSMSGVYGGAADPVNFMKLFDRQVSIRMGQANVRRWSDQLLELLSQDEDVFDVAVDGQYAHTPPVEGDPDERDDPRERLDDDFDVASAREQNHEQRQSNPNEAPGDGDPSVVDGS